jgi:acetyl-CoA acetyltransferase
MTQKGLKRTGCEPIARIHDYAYSGCDPKRMGLGPIHAIDRLDVDLDRMDLIELNEAFAAQVLACQKALRIPDEKLNVNGGAIALGHPLAATGVRLVLNLVNELKHRDKTMGLAALCVGGGQGGAICLQKI